MSLKKLKFKSLLDYICWCGGSGIRSGVLNEGIGIIQNLINQSNLNVKLRQNDYSD